ncbi:hypothetical protein [Clostridium baratii]|nr:hypothetical protein [Clostridium baratii]
MIKNNKKYRHKNININTYDKRVKRKISGMDKRNRGKSFNYE